jgi:hypothetical protein
MRIANQSVRARRAFAWCCRLGVEDERQRIYDSEIKVRVSWLWDGGIDVRLGDEMNGFAEENVAFTGDIVPWLQESIAHFYLHSTYAKSLDPQTRERATRRLFRPPVALR